MMSVMSDTDARAAFMTAALVLLVMPIIFVVGLASLMLVVRITGMDEPNRLMLAVAIAWGVLVIAGVLMVARRLNRRSARF